MKKKNKVPKAKDGRTLKEKVGDYFVNEGPKSILVILWVLADLAVFIQAYYCNKDFSKKFSFSNFKTDYRFVDTIPYSILGEGVTFARGAAAIIKLNSALILITVLR